MSGWIDRLVDSNTTRAVHWSAQFAEARHKVLAENVANVDTPDYPQRRLDRAAFESALREALDRAKESPGAPLDLRDNEQVATDRAGHLQVRPRVEPAANVLFHDGTNGRLEDLVGQVQENALMYSMSVSLLRTRFSTLLSAIRGRAQ